MNIRTNGRAIMVGITLLLQSAIGYCQPPAITPAWHMGDWWRVRVPHIEASAPGRPAQTGDTPPHDSMTASAIYRYTVIDQLGLTFEEQEGPRHIGQAVPEEKCWVVRVVEESGERMQNKEAYLLYFRVDDLSLRQIVHQAADGKRRDGDFVYTSTHQNDDEHDRSQLVQYRGPYCDISLPLTLQCPAFPLRVTTPSTGQTGREAQKQVLSVRQTVRPVQVLLGKTMKSGLRAILQENELTGPTVQDWVAGYPWWVSSERRGLEKSYLIETNHGPVRQGILAARER